MKLLYKIFRRAVVSLGILYAYNIFMNQYNLPVPINIITIIITSILGIPGFIGLIIFYLINFR
ncbi:MAG: pro-sigmaK processing inhibitor BofA family protein [Bacilli bacterium]|nr:pro-sigmaK processing inhibitor BofA family protein [Bacilli bacterium]